MDFKETVIKIVPKLNYQAELKQIKELNIASYSGFSKTKLIYVTLSNSKDILIYDLTSCNSRKSYYEYLKTIRSNSS